MTRKGSRQQSWTIADEQFLIKYAGVIPRRKICREIKRSRKSVEHKAKRLGVSLRCFVSSLKWCNNCTTWRSTVSETTGFCRVCAKREMLERSEQRVSDALAQLSFEQRTKYLQEEAHRGKRKMPPRPRKRITPSDSKYAVKKADELYMKELEQWEIACLDQAINANKTRLKRIRQKLGTNPRKKIK